MQVTRLLAVRHGETAWNADGRLQGHLDIPLNDKASWRAERTGAALADETIGAIYASDLQRAATGEQAIAQAQAQPPIVQADERLRERAFGDFQSRLFGEIEAGRPEDAAGASATRTLPRPAAASLIQFRDRVVPSRRRTGRAPPWPTGAAGGPRRRDGSALPRRHLAGTHEAPAPQRGGQRRHQPPAVDAAEPSLVGWNDSAPAASEVLDESTT